MAVDRRGGVPGVRTSVLFELYVAAQLAGELVAREFERHSLKVPAHVLLTHLARRGPLTPTELARETGLRPSTLRERMQPLLDGELVQRRVSTEDRRSHTLEVTERGWAILDTAWPLIETAERALQARLGVPLEEQRAPLERLIRAAQEALPEKGAEPAPD